MSLRDLLVFVASFALLYLWVRGVDAWIGWLVARGEVAAEPVVLQVVTEGREELGARQMRAATRKWNRRARQHESGTGFYILRRFGRRRELFRAIGRLRAAKS